MSKQIKIAILADGKQSIAEFKNVGAASKYLGDQASTSTGHLETMRAKLSSMSDGLEKAGKKMMSTGRKMTVGMSLPIVAGFGAMIQAAQESNKISKITEQIIKSTGGAAKLTADQISELSTALSNKTGVDDEIIQKGQNLLLTFTKVRDEVGKGNDVFSRASLAMLDLGTVFGSSDAAAMQLGKALNDPVKGITALSKAGVTFTAEQKETIKAMVAANDILGAQKIILAEVETQVGGTAAASATGFDRMKVAVGNMAETLGNVLVPWLEKASTKVSEWTEKFQSLSPEMQKMVVIGLALAAAIGPIVSVVGALVTVIAAVLSPVGLVIVALAALAAGAVYAYRNFEGFRNVVDGVVSWLRANVPPAFEAVKTTITNVMTTVKQVWDQNWTTIKTVAEGVFTAIKGVVLGAMDAIKGIVQTVLAVVRGDWSGALEGIKTMVTGWKTQVVAIVQGLGPLLWAAMVAALNLLNNALTTGFNAAVSFVRGIPAKIVAALGNLGEKLWRVGSDSAQGLVDGLRSKVPSITGVMGFLAKTVTQGISIPLKRNSPSLVMQEIGRDIGEGLALGIESMTGRVGGVAGEMARMAAEAMMSAEQVMRLRAITGGGGGGMIVPPDTTGAGDAADKAVRDLGYKDLTDYWMRTGGYTSSGSAVAPMTLPSVSVTVMGSVTSERDLVDAIRTGLVRGADQGYATFAPV